MAKNELGGIRRSQIVATYGPGAIVDFRAGGRGGAAVSVVAAGLEEWDLNTFRPGLNNEQCVYEPRLQKRLNVSGFRLPPVGDEIAGAQGNQKKRPHQLTGIRFPTWLQCPGKCHRLQPHNKWSEDPGDPALYCSTCTTENHGRRVHVVPVRFILACESGHIDEFPWHAWVGHKDNCARSAALKLESRGSGLRGLVLKCSGCGAGHSMDGVFSAAAISGLKVSCSGRRPWLPGPNEKCQCPRPPVVVQRGASNLYFPAVESALDIPPWTDEFQVALGNHWSALESAESPDDVDKIIDLVVYKEWDGEPMTADQMKAKVHQRLAWINAPERQDLRTEEYRQLTMGEPTRNEEAEFSIRPEPVPISLHRVIGCLTRVVRLREVRATYGFTRIHPPSGDPVAGGFSPLSVTPRKWLPAIEVRGEGIFLTLDEAAVCEWEKEGGEPAKRAAQLQINWRKSWKERSGSDSEPPFQVTARMVLLHTFSHALMRQLSLECGYSTSSLRERLYSAVSGSGMCGVLIYTSASDADGTLGGLVRQGTAERMAVLVRDAIRAMEWCSSDPLCITGITSLSDSNNLAACHSCVLAPETSCEHFNRFLDRATLVGLPGAPEVGFFSNLLKHDTAA
jgi:hypothetical protein